MGSEWQPALLNAHVARTLPFNKLACGRCAAAGLLSCMHGFHPMARSSQGA